MKRRTFIFKTISTVFFVVLFIQNSSNTALAQLGMYGPGTTYIIQPIKNISAITGFSSAKLQTAGCKNTPTQIDEKTGLAIRIQPSDKVFIPNENSNSATTNSPKQYFVCSIPQAQKLLYGTVSSQNTITSLFIDLAVGLLWYADAIGILLLNWSGKLLMTMLSQGTFIQNTLVRQAWPYVQGIANLGFIFALLYIALATTLRLESIGTAIQRLLPKLLIGALLVNFSLVIGGLLIDASRLVMAVEIQVVGGGEVTTENISVKLVEQAKLYETFAKVLTINPVHGVPVPTQGSGWNSLVSAITRSFFILATAGGMAVLAIGLLWRYVMLLILLIISPMAYLAITLPQTTKHAKKWWEEFIKWVTYGPIMLFFLIIITRIQATNVATVPTGGILDKAFFQEIVKFIIVISLFFIANNVAKKISGVGSSTVINFAKKTGRTMINNPKTALALAGLATGGVGAAVGLGAAGALGAAQYGYKRSGLGEALKIRQASLAKQEKDKRGKTFFAEKAKYMYGSKEYQDDINAANALKKAPSTASITDPAFAPIFAAKNLRTASAGKAIKAEHISAILDRASTTGDNEEQLQALISNPTMIGRMSDKDHEDFNKHIESRLSNSNATGAQKAKSTQLLNDYQRSMREVDKKRAEDTKTPEEPKK